MRQFKATVILPNDATMTIRNRDQVYVVLADVTSHRRQTDEAE